MKAAEAGKYIMVEKPLARNLAEADEMIEAAGIPGLQVGRNGHAREIAPLSKLGRRTMEVESFEVSGAEVVGDLLSPDRIQNRRPLKIGFMATGFFEY